MKLTVGITEKFPHWELILGQIGIPTETVTTDLKITTDQYATIIVTRIGEPWEKDALLHYIAEGGATLIEADVARWLLGIRTVPAYIKYVEPVGDPIYKGILSGFIDASLTLPKKATVLESDSGKKLVQIIRHGNGLVLILPGSLSKAILDTKVRRRNFPTRKPLLPSERVTRRSKQTIREIIQRSLEYLYIVRELPFVSLWPLPNGAQTLFNLRIDTDFASQENVDTLYDLCQKYRITATWFVETQSSQDWISKYANMEYQEIGLHCYRHHVFPNFIRNEMDIKRGIKILSQHRIRPSGYAAPFGQWNVPLAKAIEHHGFLYSSEFCLDYDNLPFHSHLGDRFTHVLQVPVHPIATSCLRNARHSKEDMKKYFKDLLKICIEHHLPFFIYDHPSNANLDVLNWLFKTVRKQDIPVVSLIEYAEWWNKRAKIEWTVDLDKDRIVIDHTSIDSSIWLLIRKSMTGWSVVEMKDTINLNTVEWRKRRLGKAIRTPMSERTALTRKMVIRDILHMYWKHRY